jgi:hypothetical protein
MIPSRSHRSSTASLPLPRRRDMGSGISQYRDRIGCMQLTVSGVGYTVARRVNHAREDSSSSSGAGCCFEGSNLYSTSLISSYGLMGVPLTWVLGPKASKVWVLYTSVLLLCHRFLWCTSLVTCTVGRRPLEWSTFIWTRKRYGSV